MAAIWIPKRLVEVSLINSAKANEQQFINHCEITYEYRVVAAAKEILQSNTKIIMLTGPSSSGKTTTSNKLANALREMDCKAQVISLDEFYKNREDYPKLANGEPDFENVMALDIQLIKKCIKEIIEFEKTDIPQFSFVEGKRKNKTKHIDAQNGVIIIEGIHALNPILIDSLNKEKIYKIYVGLREEYSHIGQRIISTRDIRLVRRMIRDAKNRGRSIERTIELWDNICDGEDKYIKIFKPEADLLLDSSFSYEILMFASFMPFIKAQKINNPQIKEKIKNIEEMFSFCETVEVEAVPKNSMLREFI